MHITLRFVLRNYWRCETLSFSHCWTPCTARIILFILSIWFKMGGDSNDDDKMYGYHLHAIVCRHKIDCLLAIRLFVPGEIRIHSRSRNRFWYHFEHTICIAVACKLLSIARIMTTSDVFVQLNTICKRISVRMWRWLVAQLLTPSTRRILIYFPATNGAASIQYSSKMCRLIANCFWMSSMLFDSWCCT